MRREKNRERERNAIDLENKITTMVDFCMACDVFTVSFENKWNAVVQVDNSFFWFQGAVQMKRKPGTNATATSIASV